MARARVGKGSCRPTLGTPDPSNARATPDHPTIKIQNATGATVFDAR